VKKGMSILLVPFLLRRIEDMPVNLGAQASLPARTRGAFEAAGIGHGCARKTIREIRVDPRQLLARQSRACRQDAGAPRKSGPVHSPRKKILNFAFRSFKINLISVNYLFQNRQMSDLK
jgi:hypothetical protein